MKDSTIALVSGIVLLGIATAFGPTTTETEVICAGHHCYEVEVEKTNPGGAFFGLLGFILLGMAVVMESISTGIKQGMEDDEEEK